jgi:hypothetical protein
MEQMDAIEVQMPPVESRAGAVVEAVVPTACLSQALGTWASTTFERLARYSRLRREAGFPKTS